MGKRKYSSTRKNEDVQGRVRKRAETAAAPPLSRRGDGDGDGDDHNEKGCCRPLGSDRDADADADAALPSAAMSDSAYEGAVAAATSIGSLPSSSDASKTRRRKKKRRKKTISREGATEAASGGPSSAGNDDDNNNNNNNNNNDSGPLGATGPAADGGGGGGGDDDDDDDPAARKPAVETGGGDSANCSNPADFPFEVDPDDHCESPIDAYQDVACLLRSCARFRTAAAAAPGDSTLTSTPAIYDPYYCNGAVVRNLNQLGFDNVYNRNEDCYEVWSKSCSSLALSADKPSSSSASPSGLLPYFDVLVTNPPYSADHVEKLLQFVTSPLFGDRPWFLLMPNWVVKKDYYDRLVLSRGVSPFYVVPRRRYVYLPPPHYRSSKASDTHKKSSPFVSLWYVWGGTPTRTDALLREFYRNQSTQSAPSCDVARSKSALRDLRRKKPR